MLPILLFLLLPLVHSQFVDELPVALKPPPVSSNVDVQFIQDISSVQQPIVQPSIVQQPVAQQAKQYAHHAVLFNSEQESKLPPNLINPFYKDPRIAEALAKQSWFIPGENHVTDRDSEKIPRDRILYALKSAGLARRRRSFL